MAELKEKFFGKVSGAFGDFIGVVRGNSNYILRKSSNRKIDNSPAALARRKKFGTVIKAAKSVTLFPVLKVIWKEKAPDNLSAYNFFIKTNYNYVDVEGSLQGFTLLPGLGFAFSASNFSGSAEGIDVTVAALAGSTDFDTEAGINIQAFFLIELKDPANTNNQVFFLAESADAQVLDLDNPLTFSVSFTDTENALIAAYPVMKTHLVLCTLDEKGKAVQWSSTLTQ